MRKHLAITAVIISAVLTLSGCFPTGEKDPNISADLSGSGLFEYSKDNLTVSFEIPEFPGDLPMRIKLKEKTFDTEEMKKLFLSGKTILEDKTFGTNYWTDDGSHLSVSENELSFSDGKTAHPSSFLVESAINYQFVIMCSKECYKDILFIDGEELDGFSSQSAIDRALELTSALGITNLGEPDIYTASLDVFEKLKEYKLADLNEEYPLTKDIEAYILRFPQVFDGIELANLKEVTIKDSTNKDGVSHEFFTPMVTVGVSRNEIFHFSVDKAYEAEYEIINTEPLKYDFNYALSDFSSYLDRSFFKTATVINNAGSAYFPVERNEPGYIEYSLAWSFYGYEGEMPEDYFLMDYNWLISSETGVRQKSFGG